MRNSGKIITIILLLGVVGLIAWPVLHPEPEFQGKRVSRWLQQKLDGSGDWQEVTNAFFQIGPPAIPCIAGRLRRDNSGLARGYRQTWARSPGFLKKIIPEPGEPMPEVAAVNAFCEIGPRAIPSLTALLGDRNPLVRSSAAWALGSFQRTGHGDAVKIAELVNSLKDSDARVRLHAAGTLGEFGEQAVPAIAPLIARLKDDEKGLKSGTVVPVRSWAARALGRIGPTAEAAAPALVSLSKDTNSYTRMAADIALWRIRRNVAETLPRLTNDLSQAVEYSKWEIFEALAEIGPAAKSAEVAIAPDLKSQNPEVRQRAAEALWKIDPAQAPLVVEALIEPMNDPIATSANAYSVTEGAKLLGEMGSGAESAAPSLEKLLKHSYPPARTAAAEALRRIRPLTPEEAQMAQKGKSARQQGDPATIGHPE